MAADWKQPVIMSTGKHYYIEETDAAVRAKGSQRASDIVGAQRQAIERAKEFNPNDRLDVERVRNTKVGGPDKWRSRK